MRRILDIKNYDKNARTHSSAQIREIADSIKNFGFNDPIELDKDDIILSGHGRLAAAFELGLDEVPTITHDHLADKNRKAYVLAANRIAQNAGWDADLLKEEFEDLSINDDFDLGLTGFTDEEIKLYLNPDVLNEGLTDENEQQEFDSALETISKKGDLWILGNHRLKCGDSTVSTDVDELIADHKPNLMVTDPPYGVEYDPAWRNETTLAKGDRATGIVKNDDKIDWMDAYSLFPGAVAYVWHAGKYGHIVGQNLIDCGFDIVSQIIWAKQHFAISRGDYHWQHEPCLYVVRRNHKHAWRGARDKSTLWEIKNNGAGGNHQKEETFGHGTQKPIECMSRPIENNSMTGDYVYDPFGGSGTTLIACEKLGRKCLMMEIDEKYCDMIIRRWEKFTGLKAILSNENGN